MLNSVLVLLAVVFIGISAISISVYSSYYTGIQRSLEAKAKTATDFFSNYIMRTAAEYYQSAYR